MKKVFTKSIFCVIMLGEVICCAAGAPEVRSITPEKILQEVIKNGNQKKNENHGW